MGQIGFLTAVIEALAGAVGAGMLLGGFAAGAMAIAMDRPRLSLDRWVLIAGYLGGAIGMGFAALDCIFRYG